MEGAGGAGAGLEGGGGAGLVGGGGGREGREVEEVGGAGGGGAFARLAAAAVLAGLLLEEVRGWLPTGVGEGAAGGGEGGSSICPSSKSTPGGRRKKGKKERVKVRKGRGQQRKTEGRGGRVKRDTCALPHPFLKLQNGHQCVLLFFNLLLGKTF